MLDLPQPVTALHSGTTPYFYDTRRHTCCRLGAAHRIRPALSRQPVARVFIAVRIMAVNPNGLDAETRARPARPAA